MTYNHKPVLLKEVVEYLRPKAGGKYIDGTMGGGGHLIPFLYSSAPDGKVLGIDLDTHAHEAVKLRVSDSRLITVRDNYKNIKKIAEDNAFSNVHGILLDLGYSSHQIESPEKGMSFQSQDLDMRFDASQKITAHFIVNTYPQIELERILREFGEEPLARPIATEIIKRRKDQPIETGETLAEIVSTLYRRFFKGRSKIHPATRVFQALRITVNNELGNLKKVLPDAVGLLEPGGRLAIISYHSLEDRIVKNFFKLESTDCICPPQFPICQCGHKASIRIITKKPLVPSDDEIEKNPRSRSAKLRVAEKI